MNITCLSVGFTTLFFFIAIAQATVNGAFELFHVYKIVQLPKTQVNLAIRTYIYH